MPSTSPGTNLTSASSFVSILPGAPNDSFQCLSSFLFRYGRYVVYISGRQVNILSAPNALKQAITFNNDLVAVAAEPASGKIVVACSADVWVLEPVTEGWTKVWWEKVLRLVREDAGDETSCLSWGNEGEVLVGGSRMLSLFSTLPSSRTSAAPPSPRSTEQEGQVEERRTVWSKSVASPVRDAAFSPSANLIATCGNYDRLVKIWRRLSFEEGLFDYTYLPHPGAVTHLEWRPAAELLENDEDEFVSSRGNDDDTEVLYTISNDGLLRVWRTGSVHDLDILVLHTTVDLVSAIPQSPVLIQSFKDNQLAPRPTRYAFILPSDQFAKVVSTATGLPGSKQLSHSLEHLKETCSKEPDVIVTLDGRGRMSAWGLQSIGHKRRPDTPSGLSKNAFHIAHAEDLPLWVHDGANMRCLTWFDDCFNLLTHDFDGEVRWWRGDVETVFSPSASGSERLQELACWSGHRSSITALHTSGDGEVLASWDESGRIVHWEIGAADRKLQSSISYDYPAKKLLDAIPICREYTISLELDDDEGKLALIIRYPDGRKLTKTTCNCDLDDESATWQLFASNTTTSSFREKGVALERHAALSTSGKGLVVSIPSDRLALENRMEFMVSLPEPDDCILHAAAVLDAAESDRVGVVAVTKSGSLLLYHVQVDGGSDSSDAMLLASFESGMQRPSLLAVNNDFAAIASSEGRELAIVNLRDGYVEHRHVLGDHIRQLVPNTKHNLVAVGYDTSVNILAQGLYQHYGEVPAWILIQQISLAGIGLAISSIAWFNDGGLAIAAGNGIFVTGSAVSVKELGADVREAIDADSKSTDDVTMAHLAQELKKPLPVWHPSLLNHLVRHGHWSLASSLVCRLLLKLKFWSEGDALHPHLNVPAEQLYGAEGIYEEKQLDQDTVDELIQQLGEKDLPAISQTEQQRLKLVLEAMMYCSEHVGGLDNAALRFLFSWKLELLHMEAKHQRQPNGVVQVNGVASSVPKMHWREIAFVFHSTTQQPLLDILVVHYDNKITWDIARHLGLFAWLSDREALDQIFEALAQSAYRATDPPDPINASIYFLALHKKPTLLALWRIATWHKEQRATMNFLRRDFTQADSKTAAKKNAYALMGRRRFDYAAAFFLLADDAASATSVLAGQCCDVMLAIAVARLYSGDDSPVLRKLLEDRLMTQAEKTGDRWLLSWCHSILLERDSAAEALVHPFKGVRTWHQDDPNTLTLYKILRKGEQSEHEYEAVLRAARILRRMGLWLLALELVSQWEFNPQQTLTTARRQVGANDVHEQAQVPSMLDSFTDVPTAQSEKQEPSSLLDDFTSGAPTSTQPESAMPDEKTSREAKAAELLKKLKAKKQETSAAAVLNEKKPEPTQFKEPDANSLLDNFGF